MTISQESIELARDAMRRFGKSDCAYQLGERILREAGELPPPEVRVPDCFRENHWIARDEDGEFYIYSNRPKFVGEVWASKVGHLQKLIYGSCVILPEAPPENSCWQVSELYKMAVEYAEREAKQEPTEAENIYKSLYEKALSHVDRVFQDCSENPNPILPDYTRLGDDKFEAVVRLAEDYKQLLERQSQLEKDHEAMNCLRDATVTGIAKTQAGTRAGMWNLYFGHIQVVGTSKSDPADAILAAKGGE